MNGPSVPRRRGAATSLTIATISGVLLAACGSDGDTPSAPTVQTGTFGEVPVTGLNYVGTRSAARTTDATGNFSYTEGETLSFSVGNLLIGTAPAAPTMTTLGVTLGASAATDQRVTNKLVLLQTIDADGDLNNGIQISDAVRNTVSARAGTINFDQAPAAFRTSLEPLLAALEAAGAFTDLDTRARTARTAAAAQEHFARATATRQVVTTTHGRLSGFEANANTWQFLGIPYAKPPVGSLRWRAPQDAVPWNGVRQAIAYSNQSAQTLALESVGEGGMSEDSLYLNVTAPKNASGLPVMVWFHGGAFAILSGNTKQYNNPDGLTTKGVVLVTVNHRLGPFGYMAHPLLSAESGHQGSGNYGQMDLVKALQWVKLNIAQFGGNPANVTIFGQSGGGGKTYSLMNAPSATGLFHKAIVQSGANPIDTASTPASSLAAMEAVGSAMFARLKVTTLEQARALPWTAFIDADTAANIPREIYRPNFDNNYLPKTYAQNMQQGMASDVPLMVGATSGDYSTLRAALPVFMTQRTPTYRSPQYVYRFSRVPDGWAAMGLLTAHGGEIPYQFNYPMGMVSNYTLNLVLLPNGTKPPIGDLNGNGTTGTAGDTADIYTSMQWGPEDVRTVDLTMTLFTQFAKTGNPSTATLAWPAYTLSGDQYVEVGPTATATVKRGLATAFP